MSNAVDTLGSIPLKGAGPEEGARCLIAERFSSARLRNLLESAPQEVRASIDEVERERTLTLQIIRIACYLSIGIILLFYRPYVGKLVFAPFLFTLGNVIAYFLLRRTASFRGLNVGLFAVDIFTTEISVWQFSPAVSHLGMFYPALVVAMVFFLPARSAVVLSLLMLAAHLTVLFGMHQGWFPVGPVAAGIVERAGYDPSVLRNPLSLEGAAIVATFFIIGMLVVGRSIFGLLRQREVELARATEVIRRYVPTQLADQILAGEFTGTGSERRKLTIFFSDIQGFTETSDQLEAEDLSRILNEYLSEMAVIAETHGGTIDKFVGDAIMIFFGAPAATTDKDHAVRAVCMARQMQQRMKALKQKWFDEGIQTPFNVRIGINTGVANVGSFGSAGRMDYTAIGNQVNLAARLESKCEPGKILLSHATWALVKDEIPCTPKEEIQVKGIHYPIKVYEVEAV